MWLALSDLPVSGADLTLTDPAIWAEPIKEFGMDCRVVTPLEGKVFLLPQHGDGVEGCLVRGSLKGQVALPCSRCAEDAAITIDSAFEYFEPVPPDETALAEAGADGEVMEPDELVVRRENGVAQINPAALLWEEFALALPATPLCHPGCQGLCPVCGHNKNRGDCGCAVTEGDPRLAALRGLKLPKQQ